MTKQEFFALRDAQRQNELVINGRYQGGEKLDYQPKSYKNDLLEGEEAICLKALNGQKSGVYRTRELGLTGLLCVEIYIGKTVKVQRKKIDEIDNVTIWHK